MRLTIYLHKEVPDRDTGLALIEQVKQKLSDHPEVEIQASLNEKIPVPPEPEPT